MDSVVDRAELRAVGRVRRMHRGVGTIAHSPWPASSYRYPLRPRMLFWGVIRAEGITPAERLALVLFLPTLRKLDVHVSRVRRWICSRHRDSHGTRSTLAQWGTRDATPSRVALVMVVRHEVVTRVQAGLARHLSLARRDGLPGAVHVFPAERLHRPGRGRRGGARRAGPDRGTRRNAGASATVVVRRIMVGRAATSQTSAPGGASASTT